MQLYELESHVGIRYLPLQRAQVREPWRQAARRSSSLDANAIH